MRIESVEQAESLTTLLALFFPAMGTGFESTIDIYLRVRPINNGPSASYEIDQEEGNVKWTIPRSGSLGVTNHQREHYTFNFSDIFDKESKQDEVFQKVAHQVKPCSNLTLKTCVSLSVGLVLNLLSRKYNMKTTRDWEAFHSVWLLSLFSSQ